MFPAAILAGLCLSASQLWSTTAAQPTPQDSTSFDIYHNVSALFPNSKSDLSRFDVDARFHGYNSSVQSWMTSLDPSTGSTDEQKAELVTAAAYAKPYDPTDPEMVQDVHDLLAAVNGTTAAITTRDLEVRQGSRFILGAGHAVVWGACATFYSCISGTTCAFDVKIDQAPRSQCQQVAQSNCCVSWSTYKVRAGFFTSTWTTCDDEVKAQGKTEVSCEGYDGSGSQGGDVCFSNRPNGCT
ncbi:uncharacterized protein KY384_006260 [Bacidia gigantensis]|uniref:uncharacterized protein n=1 Tax=Bacidia gigantensis TaxID=2732470 RepID=UPI001D036BCC|nr:uncharacterized protein KY384_006260 [Bacidia gigantensis]KAG8528573.1 hypothetical protein KY384_006260 [Bacidia gigantensis]